jgi:AcrR family transcriptional regulator
MVIPERVAFRASRVIAAETSPRYSSRMDENLGLRARKKIQTRRIILKSADELFHEKGFAATTLDEIAAKAGVHRQTVLRYFGSKEAIALAFRQVALHHFKKGLHDPKRAVGVLEYWRNFIEASTAEVARRGDMLRYAKLVESEPALMAASLAIHMQYEEVIATALSLEAGEDPESDLYSRLLATFLVNANFSVARMVLNGGSLEGYVKTAVSVVDFAIQKFPPRNASSSGTSHAKV